MPSRATARSSTAAPRPYQWNTFSPRIGLTWDVTGDGKTVAKLALSQYGDVMGDRLAGGPAAGHRRRDGLLVERRHRGNRRQRQGQDGIRPRCSGAIRAAEPWGRSISPTAFLTTPAALTAAASAAMGGASIWNSDVYFAGYVSGFDWNNPLALDYTSGITTYFLNRKAQSDSRTREVLLTLEREIIPDFSAQVNLTYRKYDHNTVSLRYYPDRPLCPNILPTPAPRSSIRPWPRPVAARGRSKAGRSPTTTSSAARGQRTVNGNWVNTGGTTYSTGDAAGRPYYVCRHGLPDDLDELQPRPARRRLVQLRGRRLRPEQEAFQQVVHERLLHVAGPEDPLGH